MTQKRPIKRNYFGTATIVVAMFLFIFLFVKYYPKSNGKRARSAEVEEQARVDESFPKKQDKVDWDSAIPEDFLPTSTTGVIVKHKGFVLSYSENYEQAEWVAYVLTKDMFASRQAKRSDNFRADERVPTRSATPEDYRGSGFDRGHLCPASDMAYREDVMDETFLMSNMSPQVRNFNGGIWRELEENVKDWARKYQKIYVVTGPILKNGLKSIGRYNKVAVPEAYYKVILNGKLDQAIAYIMPNQISDRRIETYATSIDAVEQQTHLNFFSHLLSPQQEAAVEAQSAVSRWPTSEKRYQIRLNEWNKR